MCLVEMCMMAPGEAEDEVTEKISEGIIPTIDAFGKSIGRRYARADEIGIPWAITIDHQSTIDNTVTVRKRDNQQQIRMDIQDLISRLAIGNLADSNKWNN